MEAKVQERTAELQRTNASLVEEVARRKIMEQELRSAKDQALMAVKEKNQLIANMSHDLRTPLSAIVYVKTTFSGCCY